MFRAFTQRRRQTTKPFRPWYGILFLVIIAVAFGLKIIDALKPDKQPISDVPAISYDDLVSDDGAPELPDEVTHEPEPTMPDPVDEPTEEIPSANPDAHPPLPLELNLAVPFTSQAPTSNWDAFHEDTCEEASFLMTVEFYGGRAAGKIDPTVVEPELTKLVDLETSLGMGFSISLAEAAQTIDEYYGLKTVILDNPTVDDIKSLIASGKPVIVPAAGRELGNPNFTGEGPLYHMYVIRGYTESTFITNDPGTRNGENYVYDIDVVMSSMGDWNSGDPTNGAKRVLYIEPN